MRTLYLKRVPTKRRETSLRVRLLVLQRDDYTCQYCGASVPDVRLEIDHIVPVAYGGTNEPTNLVAACVDCNSGKNALIGIRPASQRAWSMAIAVEGEDTMHFAASDPFIGLVPVDGDLSSVDPGDLDWLTEHCGAAPAPEFAL